MLDVIGLHPASVEFHHRYAESTDHLVNYARFHGTADALRNFIEPRSCTACGRGSRVRVDALPVLGSGKLDLKRVGELAKELAGKV